MTVGSPDQFNLFVRGLVECYVTQGTTLAEQTIALMMSNFIRTLASWTETSKQDPSVPEGLALWKLLMKHLDGISKLGPDCQSNVAQSATNAVNRLAEMLYVGGKTHVKQRLESDGVEKGIEKVTNELADPMPDKLGCMISTLKQGYSWTTSGLEVTVEAIENPTGAILQPYLSLYVRIKSLDMKILEELLPEKHGLAVTFLSTFEKTVKAYLTTVEHDVEESLEGLKQYRQDDSLA